MACAILPSQELTNFFIKDKEEPAANVDVRVRRSVVTVPDEAYVRSVVPVTTTVDSPVFVSTLFYITLVIIRLIDMGVSHPHTPASLQLSDEPAANADARARRSVETAPEEAHARPEAPETTTDDSPQSHIPAVEIVCVCGIPSG